MSQPSYFVLALSVLNLLLVAAGVLLVYLDWSAARRREFLYLYFTEERPGAGYFSAARRRRTQYTRLLIAFTVLLLSELLGLMLYIFIAQPEAWSAWTAWHETGKTTAAVAGAAGLEPWLQLLEMFGMAWLVFGFLYNSSQERVSGAAIAAFAFMTAWAVLLVLLTATPSVLGFPTAGIVHLAAMLTHFGMAGVVIAWALARYRTHQREAPSKVNATQLYNRRSDIARAAEPGLLVIEPRAMVLAFGAWLIGSFLADMNWMLGGLALGHTVAYCILVGMVARGLLSEYESVESSRHRMGRERQVIVSFLRRIGAAFTTAVDVEQVLRIILESALETTEALAGAIYLYRTDDSDNSFLEARIVLNFFPPMYVESTAVFSPHRTEDLENEMKHQTFRLGEGVIGEVAESGQARLIENVSKAGIMLGATTEYMRNLSMLVVPLRIRDEPLGVMVVLNKQRGSFGTEDQALLQSLADQASLSLNNAILTVEVGKQERLRRDLQIARDIQQRLLPHECPVLPGFELGARATSATEVGGDYYDFFWVDDDHLAIVVADVSGKGVHAALIAAMIRSAFRAQARDNIDVRNVLSSVNDFISRDLRPEMFVTCIYGVLEISTRRFSWARAGHDALIVAHPSHQVDVLSPDGFALGVIGSPEFDEYLQVETVDMKKGDQLLIYTDGLTEAMNTESEEFGLQRVLDILTDPALDNAPSNGHFAASDDASPNGHNLKPAAAQSTPAEGEDDEIIPRLHSESSCDPNLQQNEPERLKAIVRAVEDHVGAAAQSDDLTIVYLSAK